VTAKKARYYKCGALKPNDLSELFQVLLTSVRTAYKEGTDSTEVFDMLVRAERIRAFKKYAFDAILKLSVMDLLKTIGNAFHLVMPKSQSRKPDD
jgi:hypothetical protein